MKTITLYTKPIPVNQRTMIVRGHQTSSKKWKDTKYALALETRSQVNFKPFTSTLAINLLFYFGDNRKRDIDAYIKIVLDSMEGIVYENDSQVAELHCFKIIDKENPRTVIEII